MKNLFILTIAFSLIGFGAHAQKNAIEKYFSQYDASPDFTKVHVTSKMFELAVHVEGANQDEQEMLDAISKVEGLTVVAREDAEDGKALFREAIQKTGREFEELMTVEDEEAEVLFMISEDNGVINELLLLFGTPKEFGIVDIWGEIDLKQLRKMTEAFQVYGMKYFNEEYAEAGRAVKHYPNPVQQGANSTLEVPENLSGAQLMIHDINGNLMKEMSIRSTRVDVPMSTLKSGNYIISITKDNTKLYSEKVVVVK